MGAALFGYSELYGQVPAAKLSFFAYRKLNSPTSRFRRGRRTHGLSTFPTYCPLPGKRSPTRIFPTAAR
jgi:hypothetical protein